MAARIRLMIQLVVVLLLFLCSESSGEQGLECHEEGDKIVCSFSIHKNERDATTLEYCQDDYCIKATVQKEVVETQNEKVFHDGLLDYAPPLEQYGRNVARVLQRRPAIKQASTVDAILTLADWYSELGKAYRLDGMIGMDTVIDWNKMDIDACISVFEHAVAAYNRAMNQNAPLTTRLSLASVESFLAESLVYHPTNPQTNKALQYFESAVENYRAVLDSKTLPEEDQNDWEILLANTMGHTATLLLEDSGGMDGEVLTMEAVADVSGFLESAGKAEEMLNNAVGIYQKALQQAAAGDDSILYQLQLATLLHNLGTARMITSTVGRAVAVMEEARDAFQQVIPRLRSLDREDAIMGMAELLISLSDAYLQAGNYVQAKLRYKDAMDWYKQHNLKPAQVPVVRNDELLVEMEEQLAEYHASLMGGGGEIQIPDDYRIPGEPIYEPDNRYEADLYAAIGSIELSHGQVELALTRFVKAIGMYEDLGGEERAIADVRLNMAMGLFRLRKYDDSLEEHFQALDMYHKVVGDGKNPLIMDDILSGKTINGEEANAENENAFRTQLVNMEALQQNMANLTSTNDEL